MGHDTSCSIQWIPKEKTKNSKKGDRKSNADKKRIL